jgi:hypothetical protein
MTADPNTPPPPDPPDDDAELIAYLDGELDEDESRAVESRLADDPDVRTKADEYQKTYDLLDYLPKPSPSPTFTTRTLTALQPAIVSPSTSTTSQPVPLPAPRRAWPEVFGWMAAVVLTAGGGYLAHRVIAPHPADKVEPASADDYKLMGKLPLYVGVDDLDFLQALDKSDLFDPVSVSVGGGIAIDRTVPASLSDDDRDRLYAQFRAFSPARQQQLRTLHQQLSDPSLNDRAPLLRTLEAYAVWLDRLPPVDRRRVLDAPPTQRLEEVQSMYMKQWRDGLSEAKRLNLKQAVGEERAELVNIYRDDERSRRHEWELAQRQWTELSGKDKVPWPFNDPALSREIDKYIHSAFGVDPNQPPQPNKVDKKFDLPAECRLTRDELLDLVRIRKEAIGDGYWLRYGSLLLRLSEQHPTLPRPRTGSPIVRPADLPKAHPLRENPMPRMRTFIGKWPDFALEVARVARPEVKFDPLGPCRPDEFTDPVKQFVLTKLTDADRKRLEPFLGRWPQYPQRLIDLAREKNLSVPEVMLPGEPKKWQEFYQLSGGKK